MIIGWSLDSHMVIVRARLSLVCPLVYTAHMVKVIENVLINLIRRYQYEFVDCIVSCFNSKCFKIKLKITASRLAAKF